MPLAVRSSGSGRIQGGELPAGKYAHIGFTGHYRHLIDVNAMLIGWARFKELQLDAHPSAAGEVFASRIEVYATDPEQESDPKKWQSEVFIRLVA
jgi:effector-binding domain-containing protein